MLAFASLNAGEPIETYELVVEIGNDQLGSRLVRICEFCSHIWATCSDATAEHVSRGGLEGSLDVRGRGPGRKVLGDHHKGTGSALDGQIVAVVARLRVRVSTL